MTPSQWVDVASARAVRRGRARAVVAAGHGLLLCNVDGELYAIADVCTHDGGRLGPGRLDGVSVQCPRHGACFDVRDGAVVAPPAIRPIGTYPVRIVGRRVQVELPVDDVEDARSRIEDAGS